MTVDRPGAPGRADVTAAAEAAGRGELVVVATDTVYGIGTRPDDPDATRRLFAAKRRPPHLELPVLVGSVEDAASIATFNAAARVLTERWWPGPLTIVLERTANSGAWDLGGDPRTIGVRQPDHPTALELLRRTGPLAVTSANHSGHPTPSTCDAVRDVFGEDVAVYLCDDTPSAGTASTVVDLTAGQARVLRAGVVREDQIEATIRAASA